MIEAKETLTGDITSKQFIEGSLNVKEVKVYPELEDITIVPTKEQQTFTHEDSYGYDKVTVDPIPDEYIIPDGTLDVDANGDVDVTNFKTARVGVYTPLNLQDKEVTVTENGTQNITYDEGYDGLNSVEINANFSVGKYSPTYISFYNYTGTNLDYELSNMDTINMTSFEGMFASCKSITNLDLSQCGWNTTNITSTKNMFNNCLYLRTIDMDNLDLSNVTDASYMFSSCARLTNVDLSSLDLSGFRNISSMFQYACSNAGGKIILPNMINVTNMGNFLLGSSYSRVTEIDISNAGSNVMGVGYFDNAFCKCNRLTSINLTNVNVGNVTSFYQAFTSCSALTSLDLSSFNPTKATNVQSMFNGCSSLQYLDVRNFNFTNATSYNYVFQGIPVDCEIIVKDEANKEWVLARRSDLTNVKTVSEL